MPGFLDLKTHVGKVGINVETHLVALIKSRDGYRWRGFPGGRGIPGSLRKVGRQVAETRAGPVLLQLSNPAWNFEMQTGGLGAIRNPQPRFYCFCLLFCFINMRQHAIAIRSISMKITISGDSEHGIPRGPAGWGVWGGAGGCRVHQPDLQMG